MNGRLSFESIPFAGNTEFDECETLDVETLDPWQDEAGQDSPQRVRWIQESLNKILGLHIKIDGIMGRQARSAIRNFQHKRGLVADGIVGPKTEAAINAARGGARMPPPAEPPYPTRALLTPPAEYTIQRNVYGWSQYKRRVEDLPPDQRAALSSVGDAIIASYRSGAQPVRTVKVIGHADWDTPRSPTREQQVSNERAVFVTNWLKDYIGSAIAAQIAWDSNGVGATKLRVPPTTAENRRQNRRVEVSLSMRGQVQDHDHRHWPHRIPPPTKPPRQRVAIPLWVIAHRKNCLKDVLEALKAGANAVECDIRWERGRLVVQHDRLTERPFPLVPWLKGVRQLSLRYQQLSLVIFDYKTPEKGRVPLLLEQIRTHLTSARDVVPLNVLFSVGSWEGRAALEPLFADLAPHEGVSIDYDTAPQKTSRYFARRFLELGARSRNQAYGDGIFVAGPEGSTRKHVMDAVAFKTMERKIKFVYVWTLGKTQSVAEYLWIGVDGVFVNDPRIALDVLNGAPFRDRYRLAGRGDRVFGAPNVPAYVLTIKTGDRNNSGTDATVRFKLVGDRGEEILTAVNAFKPGIFERGNSNLVTLRGKDVGQPTRLIVSHDRSRSAPDWFLDTVVVQKAGDPKRYVFRFNRWIQGPATEAFGASKLSLLNTGRAADRDSDGEADSPSRALGTNVV